MIKERFGHFKSFTEIQIIIPTLGGYLICRKANTYVLFNTRQNHDDITFHFNIPFIVKI